MSDDVRLLLCRECGAGWAYVATQEELLAVSQAPVQPRPCTDECPRWPAGGSDVLCQRCGAWLMHREDFGTIDLGVKTGPPLPEMAPFIEAWRALP